MSDLLHKMWIVSFAIKNTRICVFISINLQLGLQHVSVNGSIEISDRLLRNNREHYNILTS